MIQNLHVKNVALIDEAEITFTKGLNVLTGETGAGKSILIEALGLALGDRADLSLIRRGSDQAYVELTLTPDHDSVIRDLSESGIDIDDDEIIIRRRVTPSGSDCFINGQKVTLKELSRLTSRMIDICGQRESLTLLRDSSLRSMLDSYAGAGLSDVLSQIGSLYSEYRDVLCKLEETDEDDSVRKRKADLAEFELNEIDSASLKPGEDTDLENTYRRMSNASRINEALSQISSLMDGPGGAGELISHAVKLLHSVSEYDEELDGIESSMSNLDLLSSDLCRDIRSYMSDSEFDAAEFNDITVRLDLINHLKDKYGRTIEDILAYRDEKQAELDRLSDHEAYMNGLNDKMCKLKAELLKLCKLAHDLRSTSATHLEGDLMSALKDMNFLNCDLKVKVTADPDHISAGGYDDIDFLISLNPGEPLMSLSQVASGGELSRIMLAIKCISGERDGFDTLIFDEIDTGISGVTSWKVGEKLHSLSSHHQVICITHQAQVAAQADTHFLISKSVQGDRTLTDVRSLDHDRMIDELMRMSGSGEDSEAARTAAIELKKKAGF